MRSRARLAVGGIAVALLVGACAGAPPEPTIYLECHGSGHPTVVLLSGFGNAGDVWQVAPAGMRSVVAGVSETTRVCPYDRPGSYVTSTERGGIRTVALPEPELAPARGTPVFPAAPPTGAELVAQLRALLAGAGVEPPYVLVGHSLGGVLSLLYARTYPRDVTALVLVDPPTPNFPQWLSPAAFAGNVEALADPGPSLLPGYVNERYRLDTLFAEIDAAPPLPAVPVTDLVRTVDAPPPDPLPAGLSRSDYTQIQTQGAAAADAYVRGIPGARVVPVPGGSHNLHLERPDVVVDAVREAVTGATTPPT